MNDTYLNQRYSNFVIILMLLFPLLVNSVKILSSIILIFLVAIGVYTAISGKHNPFKINELKLFSWLTVGYFVVMLLSILVAEGLNAEFHHLGRKLQFLLAPLIALAIFKIDIPLKNLLLSIKVGLIIIGIIVIAQFSLDTQAIGDIRPSGMFNQNIFGDVAVAMLFLSVVRVYNEKTQEQFITLISSLSGLFAIVLSGNRGSWLSALIMTVVFLAINYKRHLHNNTKHKLITFGIIAVILVLVSNTQIVNTQMSRATTAVEAWSDGNIKSSVGERLNMWVSGLKAAKESPLIGYGYRNANKAAQRYSDKELKGYSHLHNEYITNLVSAGIIGLLSLLALLFFPMIVFFRKLKDEKKHHYAVMGFLLCVSYTTFGFSHIAFGEENINAFYVFFMGFLLPKVIDINNT